MVAGGKNSPAGIEVCFRKEDLRLLFQAVSSGRSTVSVRIEGHLISGGKFSAPMTLTVTRGKGPLAATVTPNPLNPEAIVSFWNTKAGPVRVLVFDALGRLARTLEANDASPAGYHELRFDGRGDRGERLASGIYFYRITTPEGSTAGRMVIAR